MRSGPRSRLSKPNGRRRRARGCRAVTNQEQGVTAKGITHIGGNAAHFNLEEFGDIGLVLVLVPIPVLVLVLVLVLALVLVLSPKSFVLSSMS